jgi:hypothetical protein
MKPKLLLAIIIIAFMQSCTKEKCTQEYEVVSYTPIYTQMSVLRTVNVQPAKSITSKGKIFIKGNYIFLNEEKKGFHIIDNTNPAAPNNIAFVSIPGNVDLVGKGNYLLADNYLDLLTFDISNPSNIQLVNRKNDVLPFREYDYGFMDDASKGIITSFEKKIEKRTDDCQKNNNWWIFDGTKVFLSDVSASSPSQIRNSNGQTGSLSRFAMLNNYLYIGNKYSITPIDITNPLVPLPKQLVQSPGVLETMYPFNNFLLAGDPRGLYIFGTSNPSVPNFISRYDHWRGCDPVVAQNNTAYVTVRGGGFCGGDRNILDLIDITNINNPTLIKTYQMQNPYGLGIFNNKLGICDGAAGFKLFDATNSMNLQLQSTINTIEAIDVIMNDDLAILIAKDGLYQYNISNSSTPILLSKISITQ